MGGRMGGRIGDDGSSDISWEGFSGISGGAGSSRCRNSLYANVRHLA